MADDWTEDKVERLRKLWAEGHSTSEIGRRLGVSKNAVVGKARRAGLPSRPSPIKSGGAPAAPRPPRRIAGPTLPRLACLEDNGAPAARARRNAPRPAPVAPVSVPAQHAASVAEPAEPMPAPAPKPRGRVIECCWVEGDPGKKWRYCGDPSEPGKSYCEPHALVAYVKPLPPKPTDDVAIARLARIRAAMSVLA